MTTYQADGPYRVFDEYKRGAAPMPNWTHSPWCGSSQYRPLNFIYGDGDWEQMVDRALVGQVHLDGDYTNPISPINQSVSVNQRFRLRLVLLECEHISYTMKDVICDHVEGVEASSVTFWDCGDEEDEWLTDEQQFNDRFTSGMPFYINGVTENDYSMTITILNMT